MQAKGSELTSLASRPKKVCFADMFGLKLEFVKTITPCSSEDNLYDLSGVVEMCKNRCDINGNLLQMKQMKYLLPCFVAPSRIDGFMERVYSQNVCLENIARDNFVVTGLIRVKNVSYLNQRALKAISLCVRA